jgi:hypothetical protein
MGPIHQFPSEFLLGIPTSRNHIHNMDESMDPLGSRNIIGGPMPFKKINLFLGILNALVPIGQFEI